MAGSFFCGLVGLFAEEDIIVPIAYYTNQNYVYVSPFECIQDIIHDAVGHTLYREGVPHPDAKMRLVCTDHTKHMNVFVYAIHCKYWVLVVARTSQRRCPREMLKPMTRVFLSGVLVSTIGYLEPMISLVYGEFIVDMGVWCGCRSFPPSMTC
jgi:hypothetical protein